MGDRALEQEVLALFVHQANTIVEQLADLADADRPRLAHTLKGSARGVGAFAIADCAETIEQSPGDAAQLRRLRRLIGEASEFIASISR